jgi:hypothetical protein
MDQAKRKSGSKLQGLLCRTPPPSTGGGVPFTTIRPGVTKARGSDYGQEQPAIMRVTRFDVREPLPDIGGHGSGRDCWGH